MNNTENINYPAPKQEYKVLVRCFTFNHSKYIEDALNGFAMQQTNFPFVCLVMDDASTDGEQDVIKAWMERECDMNKAETIDIPTSVVIIVPHKTNESCTFAFYLLKQNLYGTGDKKMNHVYPWRENCEYEAMCEGDDYWIDPLKLQKQVDLLENNLDCSLCCGGFIRRQKYHFSIDDTNFNKDLPYFKFSLEDWSSYWYTKTLTLMYRAKVMEDFEYEQFKWARDVHTCYHLLKKGNGIYLNNMLGVYNMHDGGIFSLTSSDSKLVTHYHIYSEICSYYNDNVSKKLLYNNILGIIINKPKPLTIKNLYDMFKEGMVISEGIKQKVKLMLAIIYKPKSILNLICKH